MKYLLACVLALVAGSALGGELHLLELDQFSMDYGRIENYEDGYFQYAQPGSSSEHWKDLVAGNFNLNLARYDNYSLYWNNSITGLTTDHQYRSVEWKFEGGINFNNKVRLWARHLSAHELDDSRNQHFPLMNVVGGTAVFYLREHE